MIPRAEIYAELWQRQPDNTHTHLDPECKTCHQHRPIWVPANPDPQGRAVIRAQTIAAHWLQFHPCVATYAHPRKIERAA